MRLDKMVADAARLTRSEARKAIKSGTVLLNGNVVKDVAAQAQPEDELIINGESVSYTEFVYIMLNKPSGFISATEDKRQKTVMDLIEPSYRRYDLFPVGRLDIDTEGFLLLTNDGALAHNLLSPSKKMGKTYFVRFENKISDEEIEKLRCGVDIGETITKPARAARISENEIELTIIEGKFHQIKRMAVAVDNKVSFLKRLAYGNLWLDEELKKGEYRHLTMKEIELLCNVDKKNI